MRALIILIAVCVLSPPTQADDEYRYGVSGSFTLTPEGTVADLDVGGSLPRALQRFVESEVNSWRFEPVVENGQPVSIEVRFGIELIGTADGNEVVVTIGEINYYEVVPSTAVTTVPPVYPTRALQRGQQATVVAELHTGPDGHITEVHISRVGIVDGHRLSPRERRQAVRDFSAMTISAMERWIVSPPPDGISGTVRITTVFQISGQWATADGSGVNYMWYELGPAPWRPDHGERVTSIAPAQGGEYDLGDARIRRLEDAAPGS